MRKLALAFGIARNGFFDASAPVRLSRDAVAPDAFAPSTWFDSLRRLSGSALQGAVARREAMRRDAQRPSISDGGVSTLPASFDDIRAAALGACAFSTRRCPQSGVWRCEDLGEETEGREIFIRRGERMPHLVVTATPTLWQRLSRHQPTLRFMTSWTLVAYGNTAAPQDDARAPQG